MSETEAQTSDFKSNWQRPLSRAERSGPRIIGRLREPAKPRPESRILKPGPLFKRRRRKSADVPVYVTRPTNSEAAAWTRPASPRPQASNGKAAKRRRGRLYGRAVLLPAEPGRWIGRGAAEGGGSAVTHVAPNVGGGTAKKTRIFPTVDPAPDSWRRGPATPGKVAKPKPRPAGSLKARPRPRNKVITLRRR